MNIDMHEMSEQAQEAAGFLKLLANSNRLMILCVLSEKELSVGELNAQVPLSQSSLSQHLSGLRRAGLVRTRREAQTIFYRVSDQRVEAILHPLYAIFCQSASG